MSGGDVYTLGDSDTAADRLGLLADVFAPATEAVLARWVPRPPDHAVDLGCGPGLTTRLVHRTTGARRTTGIERSTAHLARARRSTDRGIAFVAGDVTRAPLPVAPADLVFSRFLLTHLADPAAALRAWAGSLRPGGVLVAQETALIASRDPTLARYYELVDALQHHHGQDLTVGRRLGDLASAAGLDVRHSGTRALDPAVRAMAALHASNLRTWRTDPFARDSFDAAELDDLHERLRALASGATAGAAVSYVVGELVAAA